VLEETSRATGSRNGGARAYWTGEASTITNSTIKVGKVRIEVEKLAALMYATNENLADASQLGALLTTFAGEEMAWSLEDAIVNGDGSGKPIGILASSALVTVAAEGGQAASTVNLNNITNMWGAVLPQAKTRGAWYIHSTVFPQLMRMASAATSASDLVYMPPGGVSQAPYGTLFGRPLYEIEQANALGSVGDIFFADFGAYGLARKGGTAVDSSMHVRFLTDEMAFRVTMRVNGRPLPKSAITNAKGNATRSAFVTLAAR
jgi:HK97 family phage major capsid protein